MRGAPDRGPPAVNRAAITISIMLATIMQAIDTTIANVALPHIQGSLSAAQDQITWILTSYIVAAAIMTPLTGWLAGAFGITKGAIPGAHSRDTCSAFLLVYPLITCQPSDKRRVR